MSTAIFTIHEPQGRIVPIVANLPHSGMFVPDSIASEMISTHRQSLPNSDWHLDRLYDFLPQMGITVLQATHSRYVVDLNRSPKEPLFGNFWSSVIPETTAFGQPIYQINPTPEEIHQRVELFYRPYHVQLQELLQQQIDRFGKVYLLDLHSFMGLVNEPICLGDRNGKTCSEFLTSTVEKAFASRGYQVVRNKVFTGGYFTGHYGKMPGVEALQIETRYVVYLKTDQLDKPDPPDWRVPEFEAARKQFEAVFAFIVDNLFKQSEI